MRYPSRVRLGFALLLAVAPIRVSPVRALDITTCGQVVPAGESAVLQADLSACRDNASLTLEDGASVQLNGHSITGSEVVGILCRAGCSVKGPGKISVEYIAIEQLDYPVRRPSLTVEDLNLENNGASAIASPGGVVFAKNLTVTGTGLGFNPPNTEGICGLNLPPATIAGRRLVGKNLTVTNNAGWGVVATRLRLVRSVVTGNGERGDSVDIVARRRPRLFHATCSKSRSFPRKNGRMLPWGVCTKHPPR